MTSAAGSVFKAIYKVIAAVIKKNGRDLTVTGPTLWLKFPSKCAESWWEDWDVQRQLQFFRWMKDIHRVAFSQQLTDFHIDSNVASGFPAHTLIISRSNKDTHADVF